MGFIQKFILPNEVDFVSALKVQISSISNVVSDLYEACIRQRPEALEAIRTDAVRARGLKSDNMKELLNVFITPYDKEAIYRLLTQLEWVVLSVKHFVIEREVYGLEDLKNFEPIFEDLKTMVTHLEESFSRLAKKDMAGLVTHIDQIHDIYDQVVERCARATAGLFNSDNFKTIIMHKDILAQLKEIAKRILVTSNTLEDMAIKVV